MNAIGDLAWQIGTFWAIVTIVLAQIPLIGPVLAFVPYVIATVFGILTLVFGGGPN